MKKKVLTILFILTLGFIWGHSMMPTSASAAESGGLLELLRPFLEFFVGKGNADDHLIRKLAHLGEYFVLGTETALFVVAEWMNYRAKRQHMLPESILKKALLSEAFVFYVAFLDESIQMIVGRGPLIEDVWLDLAGGLLGVGLVSLLTAISHRKKQDG
ncbi:MAG: VanZ family protein [Lachnospiraceae bacterium]|nr:VanZ family protein [Lachnospiraceae bacterium]